jgi:hypothetical protein
MKKIILATMVILSMSGCAQLETAIKREFTSSIDLAKQDCYEIGFRPGTNQYLQCVNNVTNNIRVQRAESAQRSEMMMDRLKTTTTDCWSNGVHISCSSRRW